MTASGMVPRWRRTAMITAALCAAGTVLVWTCGPFFSDLRAVEPYSPIDRLAFDRGQLAIVKPTFARRFLVQAYRTLNGVPQAALDSPEGPPPNPASPAFLRWLQRLQAFPTVQRAGSERLGTVRRLPDFISFDNCLDDAFASALRTLEARVSRTGAGSPEVAEWLAGQQAVFENCSGAELVLPSAAPPWADATLRADRDYQNRRRLLLCHALRGGRAAVSRHRRHRPVSLAELRAISGRTRDAALRHGARRQRSRARSALDHGGSRLPRGACGSCHRRATPVGAGPPELRARQAPAGRAPARAVAARGHGGDGVVAGPHRLHLAPESADQPADARLASPLEYFRRGRPHRVDPGRAGQRRRRRRPVEPDTVHAVAGGSVVVYATGSRRSATNHRRSSRSTGYVRRVCDGVVPVASGCSSSAASSTRRAASWPRCRPGPIRGPLPRP